MKQKVRLHSNFVYVKPPPIGGVSITVPDETLTISEIMLRFTRGQSTGIKDRPVYYDEDNEFDTERDYDLTELAEMRAEHQANYDKAKRIHDKQKADEKAAADERAYFERLKKEGYAKDISQKPAQNV